MKDYMLQGIIGNGSARIYIMNSTEIVREAKEKHNTSVSVTAALGRSLTATSLMGAMQKDENRPVNFAIKSEGPIKAIVASADKTGNVRGYPQVTDVDVPLKNNGKIDVSGIVGPGVLTIMKDVGAKKPTIGQIELVSGEIAEDIAYYFAVSEQINSAVLLGVLIGKDLEVQHAGGFILQLLPQVDEKIIAQLEKNITSLPSMTDMLVAGDTLEEIIQKIAGDLEYEIHTKLENVKFHCDCSKESITEVLKSVGLEEVKLILKEDKKAEIICHYCNTAYEFSENELSKVVKELEKEWVKEKSNIRFNDNF